MSRAGGHDEPTGAEIPHPAPASCPALLRALALLGLSTEQLRMTIERERIADERDEMARLNERLDRLERRIAG